MSVGTSPSESKPLLALDAGVTTGFAWFDPPQLLRGEGPISGVQSLSTLPLAIDYWSALGDCNVVIEPCDPRGKEPAKLRRQLKEVMALLREAFPHAREVTAAMWKPVTGTRKLIRPTTSGTQHERDAIRIGMWALETTYFGDITWLNDITGRKVHDQHEYFTPERAVPLFAELLTKGYAVELTKVSSYGVTMRARSR